MVERRQYIVEVALALVSFKIPLPQYNLKFRKTFRCSQFDVASLCRRVNVAVSYGNGTQSLLTGAKTDQIVFVKEKYNTSLLVGYRQLYNDLGGLLISLRRVRLYYCPCTAVFGRVNKPQHLIMQVDAFLSIVLRSRNPFHLLWGWLSPFLRDCGVVQTFQAFVRPHAVSNRLFLYPFNHFFEFRHFLQKVASQSAVGSIDYNLNAIRMWGITLRVMLVFNVDSHDWYILNFTDLLNDC